jgi:hypothetical protein
MRRKQRRNICITIRRITVLMVSDAGDTAILGVAERGYRTYRDVLPANAYWMGQPVPRCTFFEPFDFRKVLICYN